MHFVASAYQPVNHCIFTGVKVSVGRFTAMA